MEKTLEMHLKEQLQQIVIEIREAPVPQDMTWEERVGFLVAKNNLANMLVTKYANL